jgi:hypothetical protein
VGTARFRHLAPVLPRRLPTLLTLAAALAAAPAAAAEQRSLQLLSSFPESGFGELGQVSDDGSRVFVRTNAALWPGDTDTSADVYLRANGTFLPVTDTAAVPDPGEDLWLNTITRDGSVAVFASSDRLAPTDTDGAPDVYAWSPAGPLLHVSDGPGIDAEEMALFDAVNADGSAFAFTTREKLATSDGDAELDVYLRTAAGALVHVSDDPTGADDEKPALFQGASEGLERVFFRTHESLADTDTDARADVYELGPAGLSHVSDGPPGQDAEINAGVEGLSRDGRLVYLSTRERLAATDSDDVEDLYQRRSNGILRHVSDNPASLTDGPHDAIFDGASEDGSRVWFATEERLAASDTDTLQDGYLWQEPGDLSHVSRNTTGPEGDTAAELVGSAADGRRLYMQTAEPLAATDTDAKVDVYEYAVDGSLRQVSDGPDAEHDSFLAAASSDGSRVVVYTTEPLVAGDTDAASDLYEWTPSGAILAASDNTIGPDRDLNAHLGAMSADGTRLYVHSDEPLTAGDTDDVRDLHLSTLIADPPPPPVVQPRDTTPPRLTRVRVVRRLLRFRLSEPANVKVVVRRGRTLRLARPAGANRVKLRVRRGRHRVTVTAVDAAGNRSAARRIRFRAR